MGMINHHCGLAKNLQTWTCRHIRAVVSIVEKSRKFGVKVDKKGIGWVNIYHNDQLKIRKDCENDHECLTKYLQTFLGMLMYTNI
ncbi:hypothetical protein CEXT_654491 [Caerostris extrusa]|uniref:Uncharacterized protein n=1 Tax=Caerostris extrusa TaxID=172846 RepID=A0AAV4X040_CAEEX|nr:hypothetical protein CEXT_654491 [Caerostris extrusa]